MSAHPAVAIIGPTGSGKSALAIRAAEEFHGEVINCDSLQIYCFFDIGTAKAAASERRGVPHHLIDIADPDQVFSAGEYLRRGRAALSEVTARGKLPIVAGGTGLYFRALTEGLFAGPSRDQELRRRLAAREARKPGALHRILRRLDPEAGEKIHAADVPKVIRALEVRLLTCRPISAQHRSGRAPLDNFSMLRIALFPPREALYQRIDHRCDQMFASGLVEETQSILSRGFSGACKPFESHGYRQALQLIRGELSLEEALSGAKRNTRQYAKRQMTWFRRERDLDVFRGFGDCEATQTAALQRISQFLDKHSRDVLLS